MFRTSLVFSLCYSSLNSTHPLLLPRASRLAQA